MPRHDNYFNQPTNSDGYYLSDAWIACNGKYAYIEWTKDSLESVNELWVGSLETIDFAATNGDLVGDICHVKHEVRTSPSNYTVVCMSIRLPRIVASGETIRLMPLSTGGWVAISTPNFNQVHLPSNSQTTIRNYSMVNSSGESFHSIRTGTSPYMVKSDPSTDVNYHFSMSDSSLNTSQGLLEGDNMIIRTRRGGLTMNAADPDFNGEKSFTCNAFWIGELDSFSGFDSSFTWFMSLKLPENSIFAYCKVEETGGSDDPDIDGGLGGKDIGGPSSVEAITTLSNQGGSVQYSITDYWKVEESNKRQRLLWNLSNDIGVGNVKERVYNFALKFDANTNKVTIYGGAGKPIDVVSHEVVNSVLGTSEYFAFRSEGQVKFTEILSISRSVDDVSIQEYLCYLDDKYATTAKAYYVDTTSGSDTNTGITSASPYKTIAKALEMCMPASGDQIYIKNGQTLTSSASINLFPSSIQSAPLGYSPDYPFVIGTYGSRASGRFTIDFTADCEKYLNIEQHNENISIGGIHLKSSERDILSGSFVGQAQLKLETDGYGIFHRQTAHLFQHSPDSLCVYDCEIENTLRHGIVISHQSSTLSIPSKYSSVAKTGFRNLFNANYMSQNQNHGLSSSNYGVAGIYSEKNAGIHVQDCTFFRVGWSPDQELDAGISVASLEYSSTANAIHGFGLSGFASNYDNWEGSSYARHNNQRILIYENDGSAHNEIAYISSGIDLIGSSLGFYLKSTPSIEGRTSCSIKVLDPYPRCSGNADIILGESTYGPFSVSECLFIESSGHHIVSNNSYYAYSCISQDNQFGMLLSKDYTKCQNNFFGGSSGTSIIRKSSTNQELPVGGITILDSISNHGWDIKSISDSYINYFEYMGNIHARQNGYGFEGMNLGGAVNSAIHFDKNTTQIFRGYITKNTFHSIPGCIINFATENSNSSVSLDVHRNIFDQEIDYSSGSFGSSATSYMYSFRDGISGVYANTWSTINFGETENINIYNQKNLASPPTPGGFVYGFRPRPFFIDIDYTTWRSQIPTDMGEWVDVIYTDTQRNISTYNSEELGGSSSALEFASNLFGENDLGWSTNFSASPIMEYIRMGWEPTNLDQTNYGNDYIGAVEFNFTPSTTGYKPYFGNDGENIGYGKGK